MAWDDPTSKTKLEAGPIGPLSWSLVGKSDIAFTAEANPTAWQVRTFESWQNTLEPLWAGEWDTGPSQVVSGDVVTAYNNGFNNGIAIGINIKH